MNKHLTKLLGVLLFSSAMSTYATTPPAQIPQTGQSTNVPSGCSALSSSCIASPAGSDGNLQKGTLGTNTAGRFVVGVQLDGSACPSGQEVRVDQQTGLMWVQAPTLITHTWANAIAKQPTTNAAIPETYCGYADWRLPNRNELRSLVNYGQATPATWLNLSAQGFINVQAGYYWSSSTYANYTIYAWYVGMNDGIVAVDVKAHNNYVWPVRGGR